MALSEALGPRRPTEGNNISNNQPLPTAHLEPTDDDYDGYPCSHTFGDPSASDGNYDNTGTSPLNPSPNPKPRFAHTLLHASKPISPPQNLTYGHNEQNFDASCHPFCPLVDASGPGYETVHPVNRYQWPWYFLHPFSLNAPVDGPYDACTGGNMNGRLKIGRARPETSPSSSVEQLQSKNSKKPNRRSTDSHFERLNPLNQHSYNMTSSGVASATSLPEVEEPSQTANPELTGPNTKGNSGRHREYRSNNKESLVKLVHVIYPNLKDTFKDFLKNPKDKCFTKEGVVNSAVELIQDLRGKVDELNETVIEQNNYITQLEFYLERDRARIQHALEALALAPADVPTQAMTPPRSPGRPEPFNPTPAERERDRIQRALEALAPNQVISGYFGISSPTPTKKRFKEYMKKIISGTGGFDFAG